MKCKDCKFFINWHPEDGTLGECKIKLPLWVETDRHNTAKTVCGDYDECDLGVSKTNGD
jgi:hypothetical protein